MITLILSFFFSFCLVAFILPRILLLSLRKRLFDPIDPRKVHSVPASRLGGIAFFPAIIFSIWSCVVIGEIIPNDFGFNLIVGRRFTAECLGLLILFLVGIYDDLLGVSYRKKFFVQICAATLFIASGSYFQTFHGIFGLEEVSPYIGMPITLFFFVFVTNAINLIDGIDGLASMLSMLALSVYSVILIINGHSNFAIIAIATLGALLPFWYCNVFGIRKNASSKIFMGDTGSLVVGAILGFTTVRVWNITIDEIGNPINNVCYILAYTMLLVPCFDVIRVMLHRFRQGKPVFQPDKNHIHHKFMALGMSPHKSLVMIVLMSVVFAVINTILALLDIEFIYIIITDIIIWSFIHKRISKKIDN